MSRTSQKHIKVAAYCRVSTEKDDQLSSLEAQKEFFEQYVSLHNYELVELYADEGISGTKLKNRKAFQKMMADARAGKFQGVFVKDISRFSRNAVDFLQSIRELKSMGIKCDFVNANLSTEDGEFTLGILALVAQEESANLSKRVKFGKTKNAEKGKVPNLVYGYNKTNGELFSLSIHPQEGEVVKRIYDMYTKEGYGANKIAQILNEQGLHTKRGCRFSQNSISRILSNPIYIGKVINHKEEVKDFLTGIRTKTHPKEWMVTEKPELSLISENTFEEAQKILKQRKNSFQLNGNRQSNRYALSTLMKCDCCGYSYRRVCRKFATKNYIKWECSGRNANGVDFCTNHTKVDEAELLQSIREYLCTLIADKNQFIQDTIRQLKQGYQKNTSILNEKELNEELARLKKAKSKQTEMYEVDAITLEELKQRTSQLNKSIEECAQQLALLQEDKAAISRLDSVIQNYCKSIETLLSAEAMDNHLLRQLIEKILVKENGAVEVYLKIYKDVGQTEIQK